MENIQIIKMFMFLFVMIFCILLIFYRKTTEKWVNTYSGIPGPLETGCSSCYNIPELHPKYNSHKQYKFGLEKNLKYMTLKGFP